MPATPAWPPRSAPRLFVAGPLSPGATIALDGPQAHYLARVMRVARDDAVILCDNMTGEWAARVSDVAKRDVVLTVETRLRSRDTAPDFLLCAALIKKDRFDLVLEKASELGVAAIQPVLTRRCVADKLNLDRANAILTEAAEQCARTALPVLHSPIRLDALLAEWGTARTLFFADEAGGNPALEQFAANPGPAALLIGPEGGFDDAERSAVRALSAARAITLGSNVLRAETAALVGTSLWMAKNQAKCQILNSPSTTSG